MSQSPRTPKSVDPQEPQPPCSRPDCPLLTQSPPLSFEKGSDLPDYLQKMIPDDKNVSELLSKIMRRLCKMNLPRRLDVESLAHDIWIEGWTHHKPITNELIRHRAINSLRTLREEIEVFDTIAHIDLDDSIVRSEFETLMNRVSLSIEQIKVIHFVYDKGLRVPDIASLLKISSKRVSDHLHSAIEKLQAASRGMK